MKTATLITIMVYHDGISDSEILQAAQYFADNIADGLYDDTGIEVTIPTKQVTVATAPFKVE